MVFRWHAAARCHFSPLLFSHGALGPTWSIRRRTPWLVDAFRAALHASFPQRAAAVGLCIAQVTAVIRLKRFKTAVFRHLHGILPVRTDLPNLEAAASVGAEIHPIGA